MSMVVSGLMIFVFMKLCYTLWSRVSSVYTLLGKLTKTYSSDQMIRWLFSFTKMLYCTVFNYILIIVKPFARGDT